MISLLCFLYAELLEFFNSVLIASKISELYLSKNLLVKQIYLIYLKDKLLCHLYNSKIYLDY